MEISIRHEALDPWHELARYQRRLDAEGRYGATAVFVGTMRDFNDGQAVASMTLEHYPGMTEKQLEGIVEEVAATRKLVDALIVHRVGNVDPGETIVLVAVWSAHRADAFEACRELMEALKSKAPFWKKEQLENGSRWVKQNTPGSIKR